MPSLRKRVSSYFRQLSFHNEPRDKRNINENSFVTKYLQGQITLKEGPPIVYGKNATDLPNYEIAIYETKSESIIGCYSGPKGGLTTVKRTEKHLTLPDDDIDFIDTLDAVEEVPAKIDVKKSPIKKDGYLDNTTMMIKVAGQEYCVTNKTKRHSKSHSLGSISDFNIIEIEKTKIDKEFYNNRNSTIISSQNNNNNDSDDKKQGIKKEEIREQQTTSRKESNKNFNLAKSKSEGNPFQHRKKGKIIKVAASNNRVEKTDSKNSPTDDSLPQIWKRKSDHLYGISDSLYDRNQVTKTKNGDPIADCFGAISRPNSAILAVADGVNWGEKACIAAKSAIHGCLHYLNKTLFNDTKPFDDLTIKNDETSTNTTSIISSVANTRDVFICLLRAFSCAHDLILENNGMLTTLTVAVVLPLKDGNYACCVCNVGDTLAYVYSQKWGLRELTKGSHDVNCNRDMRDALGALGPVDGINPELSNLTLSITKIQKGDIVMVASDGLTDNFDPNVCRFTVINNNNEMKKNVPVKPPRRSQSSTNTPSSSRPSSEEKNIKITETRTSSLRRQTIQKKLSTTSSSNTATVPQRSRTQIDIVRHRKTSPTLTIPRNEDGIPYITPLQRYELQLLLIEDVLRNGISGRDSSTTTARKLCENLVSFAFSITSAKRHTLEDQDLYFDNRNGVLVEVSQQEKKLRRKRGLEKVQNLPGKLDHVTVVAWNVGNYNV